MSGMTIARVAALAAAAVALAQHEPARAQDREAVERGRVKFQ